MADALVNYGAMSVSQQSAIATNDQSIDNFVVQNVDIYLEGLRYDLTPYGDIRLNSYSGADPFASMSPAAAGYAQDVIDAVDNGASASAVSTALSAVETNAMNANLNNSELSMVLGAASIGRASSEYWATESQYTLNRPPDCWKRIALADVGGAILGGIFGGGPGILVGAARGSLAGFVEAVHIEGVCS